MSLDYRNNGYISKNGAKSLHPSEHVIYSTSRRGSNFNLQGNPRRMETKLIITIFTWAGATAYFGGLFLNAGNWKGDLLSLFGFAFILLKFIRLTLRTWFEFRKQNLDLTEQKNKINRGD